MVKETAQAKDQSMEEILQSIKRIIAEEGADAGKSGLNGAADDGLAMESPVKGSAILELNDLAEAAKKEPSPILDLTEELDEPEDPPHVAPSEDKPKITASKTDDRSRDVLVDIDTLLSDETVKASAAALRALSGAAPATKYPARESAALRSGVTVEDLVVEALRPMLKDWLDANLSDLVRQMVEREIRKLST